ncbi:MAG TPA: DUF5666 domain-containing protein [Anaerolineae bacterium]|nr:DUF5666 domain-containing protein [Anaerolineae bacterium]
MDAALETKLIECLSALENGESLEQILSRYPAEATRLRPLLETAAALPRLRREPSQAARSTSRKAFLAQAATLRGATKARPARFFARPLLSLASLALALILVSGTVVAVSASALPGDPLYGVKRIVENTRLTLASDPAARGQLAAQFDQERIDEIGALLSAGREAEVEFSGVIESVQAGAWVVAGLPVSIDDHTRIAGEPYVGLRAQVRGRTVDGLLIALAITVEPGAGPTPTPRPTPQPEATATPSPTPQSTPTPTRTPTATRTTTPTATRTPPLTPTPYEVRFTGVVEQAGAQTWTIGGVAVEVNAATEFLGNPAAGQFVEVRAWNLGDGRLVALRIERLNDGGNDNGNTNGNQNGNDNTADNGNENENQNDNDNANENGNGNENGDDSGSGGGNDNSNDNGDEDNSGSGNGNDNHNDNGNGNDNG